MSQHSWALVPPFSQIHSGLQLNVSMQYINTGEVRFLPGDSGEEETTWKCLMHADKKIAHHWQKIVRLLFYFSAVLTCGNEGSDSYSLLFWHCLHGSLTSHGIKPQPEFLAWITSLSLANWQANVNCAVPQDPPVILCVAVNEKGGFIT